MSSLLKENLWSKDGENQAIIGDVWEYNKANVHQWEVHQKLALSHN